MNDVNRAIIRRLRATLTKHGQHLEANLPIENDLLEACHTCLTLLEEQDSHVGKLLQIVEILDGRTETLRTKLERLERKPVRS